MNRRSLAFAACAVGVGGLTLARHDRQGRGHDLRAVGVCPPGDEEPEREGGKHASSR